YAEVIRRFFAGVPCKPPREGKLLPSLRSYRRSVLGRVVIGCSPLLPQSPPRSQPLDSVRNVYFFTSLGRAECIDSSIAPSAARPGNPANPIPPFRGSNP